jgi:RNA polymerase-binding transcription factor DksA
MLVSEGNMRRLKEMLFKRRQEIFEWLQRFESDWQSVEERDIELEEQAQKAALTSHYNQLDQRRQEELEEIDLALCRMAAGSYGICENCHKLISLKRAGGVARDSPDYDHWRSPGYGRGHCSKERYCGGRSQLDYH